MRTLLKYSKSMRFHYFAIIIGGLLLLAAPQMNAQDVPPPPPPAVDDPLQPDQIDVVKSYEPVLADAVRFSLSPDIPTLDNTNNNDGGGNDDRTFNNYYVPNRFLTMPYEVPDIKPKSYSGRDKNKEAERLQAYNAWLRLGYGNLRTPMVDLALSTGPTSKGGRGKNAKNYMVGLHAHHLSSRGGNIAFQDFARSGGELFGTLYLNDEKSELSWQAEYDRHQVHYYGYDQGDTTLNIIGDSIRQRYQKIGLSARLNDRIIREDQQVGYDWRFNAFRYFDMHEAAENNFITGGDVNLSISEEVAIGADANIHFSNYSRDTSTINDMLLQLTPYVQIRQHWGGFKVGASAITSDGNFLLFPHLGFDVKVVDKRISLYGGWEKVARKNNFFTLASENPFLAHSRELDFRNTISEKRFLGVKASIGRFLTLNVQGGQTINKQQQLYQNDYAFDDTQFIAVYDSSMTSLFALSELGIRMSETFQAGVQAEWNLFKTSTEAEAWHLPAFTAGGFLQINPIEALMIRSELFFNGKRVALASLVDDSTVDLKSALDLNVTAKYRLVKNLAVFASVNNIVSAKYPLFYKYPTYGLNAIAGIKLRF